MKKIKGYSIKGTIKLLSGTRIGGSDAALQIGGVDNICIKHPVTLEPYLPGSSLKGKMRCEMEQTQGRFSGRDNNEPCGCGEKECLICRVFGPHKNTRHELGPTRIIVRDANLKSGGEIEIKTENMIDRQKGMATNPRQSERVVEGSTFDFAVRLSVWDLDKDCTYKLDDKEYTGGEALLAFVKDSMRKMQASGIGSSVSRGYGHIQFEDLTVDGEAFEL